MKHQIEINDTLDEDVQGAIDELRDYLLEYLEENPDTEELPDLGNDLDYSGRLHEIVDGSVPIYTKNIEDLWYLYKNEFERAYEDAGAGDNPLENNGMAAIYYYIDQKVREWYDSEAQEIFDGWLKKKQVEAE